MDGLFNSQFFERTKQAELSKHRVLQINLSTTGLKTSRDASSFGRSTPTLAFNGQGEGGPHFILGTQTPDNKPTLGMEVFFHIAPVTFAIVQVTPWLLISTYQQIDLSGTIVPLYVAMEPFTPAYGEMWTTFDINAAPIRFQVEDAAPDPTVSTSIIIGMCEL